MKILVTGGTGYIGSHTCVELIEAGHEPIVIDNLCNSNSESLNRVKLITGKDVVFYEGDVRDAALLDVHILTGRTHQIRVHMQSIHHPLAGDSIYGLSKGGIRVPRLMLHAHTLDFTHPRTGQRLHFVAEPPKEYLAAVDRLRVKKR